MYNREIYTSHCCITFSHPAKPEFLWLFLILYTYETQKHVPKKIRILKLSLRIFFGVIIVIIAFFRYALGHLLLIDIVIAIFYLLLYLLILKILDNTLTELIENSTTNAVENKKHIFYWFIFLSGLQVFVYLCFTGGE